MGKLRNQVSAFTVEDDNAVCSCTSQRLWVRFNIVVLAYLQSASNICIFTFCGNFKRIVSLFIACFCMTGRVALSHINNVVVTGVKIYIWLRLIYHSASYRKKLLSDPTRESVLVHLVVYILPDRVDWFGTHGAEIL